ncbi:ATP-binding protein [Rhabdochlamydiaceae symbiont of Dictyostelium giganteum]|uniref:ATP-binding protein n=1 Tax=Rhabdochlamydiaceae symbiont of Dictyostelium giganteum TaxID=3342349 RepID=UPI00384B3228
MQREHLKFLRNWRHDPIRVPLLIRGVRHVGKSWLVNRFGKEFSSYIEVNFEKDKRMHVLFPPHIALEKTLEGLEIYTQKKIIPGQTLLFLDEIQECPDAIQYLRYFKEEMPELHVIAAGSFLDFMLEKVGIAVGRVDYLFLYPLSFMEFLTANNRDDLRENIEHENINTAIHAVILDYLKNYMWLGGMPVVIDTWLKHKDASLCQSVQDHLIKTYIKDVQKYAKADQVEHVGHVFSSIPQQLGKKFKYSGVNPDVKTYPIKQALHLLHQAGITYPCFHTSIDSYPLGAEANEKKFKVFFFDIGIAQRILGLDLAKWVTDPFYVKQLGFSAEQLVAQEFIAYSEPSQKGEIYTWYHESASSQATVDFITRRHQEIIPVEVKSKTQGGMKSLKNFLGKYPSSPYGIRISEGMFNRQSPLHEIPLYGVKKI